MGKPYTETWNFNDALGDTIMEKYESLYVRLIEAFGKDGGGPVGLVCSPEVASIFETATCGFAPNKYGVCPHCRREWIVEEEFTLLGRVNNRFNIYRDEKIQPNVIYICSTNGIRKMVIEELLI